MFNGTPYKEEFKRRVDSVKSLLEAAHFNASASGGEAPTSPLAAVPDVSRAARGLAIVLLFAAYENLLKSLCRGLLEKALSLRVSNRRLRPGLRLFAVYPKLQAIGVLPAHRIWKDKGMELLSVADEPRHCSVEVDLFPNDGSFMKASQVTVFCELFNLGHPGPILTEVWGRLDTIVTQRNQVAHGLATPEEVGKSYSLGEMRNLVGLWEQRWCDFIDHVEKKAAVRDFYRE